MKQTLIILLRSFNVGGIETNMSYIIQNAIRKHRRVIWLSHKNVVYSRIYSSIFEYSNFEIIPTDYSSLKVFSIPEINLDSEEEVSIVVFNLKDLFLAYHIRKKYSKSKVKIFYLVPLFTGDSIFPEQSFFGILKKYVKVFCSKVYDKSYKNGNVHFFSKSFYVALQENYKINFLNPDSKLVPNTKPKEKFEKSQAIKNYCSEKFTIISAGRFDFPHKGYLLGLIEVFSILRLKYDNLRLLIVGDGPDVDKVVSLINKQPDIVKTSIELRSSVSQSELTKLMRTCNLNISVAGCAVLGAEVGIPTLPARHYCCDCEVYGFFPDSKNLITERKPGFKVDKYITDVISMSQEEYVQLAENTYHCFDEYEWNEDYPFDCDCDLTYVPTVYDKIRMWLIYSFLRVHSSFLRIRGKSTN